MVNRLHNQNPQKQLTNNKEYSLMIFFVIRGLGCQREGVLGRSQQPQPLQSTISFNLS